MHKPTIIKITAIHVTLSPSRTKACLYSCYKFIIAMPLHSEEGKHMSSLPIRLMEKVQSAGVGQSGHSELSGPPADLGSSVPRRCEKTQDLGVATLGHISSSVTTGRKNGATEREQGGR